MRMLWLALLSTPAFAQSYTVLPASKFGVVTQKEGVASTFAHDHVIGAVTYDATYADGTFTFKTKADDLLVDEPAFRNELVREIVGLEILPPERLTEVSEKTRAEIRQNMLSADQLDSKQFPVIEAVATGLKPDFQSYNGVAVNRSCELTLKVKGKEVTKKVPVIWRANKSDVKAVAVGTFKFSEFGIAPYTAMLGAVKVKDEFNVLVKLIARAK